MEINMRVTREDGFKPVTIVLESQDEVAQIYGVFNSTAVCKVAPICREIRMLIDETNISGSDAYTNALTTHML